MFNWFQMLNTSVHNGPTHRGHFPEHFRSRVFSPCERIDFNVILNSSPNALAVHTYLCCICHMMFPLFSCGLFTWLHTEYHHHHYSQDQTSHFKVKSEVKFIWCTHLSLRFRQVHLRRCKVSKGYLWSNCKPANNQSAFQWHQWKLNAKAS